MTNNRRIILIVLFFLALLFLYWVANPALPTNTEAKTEQRTTLSDGKHSIAIEIATTSEAHKRGLSGRTLLPLGQGMLFVFDHTDIYPFWMPDMHFAIDIIWIGEDKRIVFIKEHATPESYPELFTPPAPARYVLEVADGEVKKMGWKEGTALQF